MGTAPRTRRHGQHWVDMLNYIWLGLIVGAVVLGGLNGKLEAVTEAAFNAAKDAVLTTAFPLIGITALWLGLMRLAEQAGLIQTLAAALRPILRRLFPDVPVHHPAMGSMLMNMAANVIGVTNAATPLGLRAMNDLERLNPHPGTATNAMCTFLAINTSSIQLIPMTAIALMATAGSTNPTAIVGSTLLATAVSTAVGITSVKLLQNCPGYRLPPPPAPVPPAADLPPPEANLPRPTASELPTRVAPWLRRTIVLLLLALFAGLLVQSIRTPSTEVADANLFVRVMHAVSLLAIPFLLVVFPLYASLRGVKVFEEFVEGAREGFHVIIRILPYLVAMLVAVSVFRAAGGIDLLARALAPVLEVLRFPADLLPMALTRPLSGGATIGLFRDLVNTLGPDHLVTRMGGTLLGSTETTFYVIAVYFGAVGIRRTRHAVAAGLLADAAGIAASVFFCRLLF